MQFPTEYQSFIHLGRYARWDPENQRRETGDETVNRYFNFFQQHLQDHHDFNIPGKILARAADAVSHLDVMPSMRCMMTAGRALARDNIAGYNCAYREISDPRAFDEILFILMCGTGVGFSVERQYVQNLPEVPDYLEPSETVITVRDSKRGWGEGLRELIAMLYAGRVPQWDTSRLREKGARLKTMGGRASGPEPLEDLFRKIVNLFENARGRKLTSLECHDLVCMIGDCVVVGGVRRSAMLSLSNLSDQRMRDAKSGNWWETDPWRALSNNSVAYTERPEVGQYMREWLSLYDSKSGERGVFNREAAWKQAVSSGRRRGFWNDDEQRPIEFGTNPCVSGDTPILTDVGYVDIEDVVGFNITIWNGTQWSSVIPFSTGTNPTITIGLSDGSSLRCTPYHTFLKWMGDSIRDGKERRVDAQELIIGDKLTKYDMPLVTSGEEYPVDAYSQGFYAGDGNEALTRSWIYEPKYPCIDRLIGTIKPDGVRPRKVWKHGPMLDRDFVPVNGSSIYCLAWFSGLLDSDGTVTRDKYGSGFQIGSTNKDFLLRVKLMLTRLGVRAKVVGGGRSEGEYLLPDGRGGEKLYHCNEMWRILIGNTDAAHLIRLGLVLSRLEHEGRAPQRDARQFVRVVSIEESEPCETFCFTDPKANRGTFNGIVTGNCSEIILRSKQFCNLTEVIARPDDTYDTLRDKVELATILGTWQATLTDFRYLTKGWTDNTAEERLLGVSLTGIMDCPLLSGDHVGGIALADQLDELKQVAIDTNKTWAKKLNIPQATAVTCVKPSGTVSQLVNSSSGIHPRYAPTYIRRVRQDAKDPLTEMMIDQGFPHETDVMKPDHIVFDFPMRSPEGSICTNDITAVGQLEHWKIVQDHWCEHKPSITITVRENEWPQVGAWVWDNFDDMSGVSFLPDAGDHVYRQAPYEAVTDEKLQELEAKMPTGVDWSQLGEYEMNGDAVTATKEFACSAGAEVCEI